ncbi:hypothetical protein [Streptomyces mirabilis]|uniref:hypothetical protein n=1 Tax=Streptomyces mirabilis TaxID=68239 RepID=UPI0036956AD7
MRASRLRFGGRLLTVPPRRRYVPKTSSRGQLIAVKDGIDQMLEQLDLTDDEREALEGDREAVTAKRSPPLPNASRTPPPPVGPTPRDLGTTSTFVPLTQLMSTVSAKAQGQHDKRDTDRKSPGYQE